jgi:hypothetical protein
MESQIYFHPVTQTEGSHSGLLDNELRCKADNSLLREQCYQQ